MAMRSHMGIRIAMMLAVVGSALCFLPFDACCETDCSVACQQAPVGTHEELIAEHVLGGLPVLADPAHQTISVRNAYVICYNTQARVPEWVAYHVIPDYLKAPERDGEYKKFHADPDILGEALDSDYDGWWSQRGYDRGHLAPYAIAGGDRDRDGGYAVYPFDDPANDLDDAKTVCEVNYMTNVAPQHWKLNRSGGLWWQLERKLQDEWVGSREMELWVIAGCVLGAGELEGIGDDSDILVPPMFFKIVVDELSPSKVLAFLFPHQRIKHGEIEDFLVSINVIEALCGFDFFAGLDDDIEEAIEDQDTWENWATF